MKKAACRLESPIRKRLMVTRELVFRCPAAVVSRHPAGWDGTSQVFAREMPAAKLFFTRPPGKIGSAVVYQRRKTNLAAVGVEKGDAQDIQLGKLLLK